MGRWKGSICIGEWTKDIMEALSTPVSDKWKKTMEEEIKSMEEEIKSMKVKKV